jgi:cobalt/nickel transport system permease protein
MAAEFLDRYSRGDSVCHRLAPRVKIVATLGFILAALLIPISLWPLHGCLAALAFMAHAAANIPNSYLIRRIVLLLPILALMSLAVPISRGFQAGWDIAGGMIVRSLLAFVATLWLVNTTPFDRLLVALRGLGMPRIFVALLAFTYRYIYVIFDELARMRTAQRARTFGRRGAWATWKSAAQLVAMLVIRSMNRSERVHNAMLARGWNGDVRVLD